MDSWDVGAARGELMFWRERYCFSAGWENSRSRCQEGCRDPGSFCSYQLISPLPDLGLALPTIQSLFLVWLCLHVFLLSFVGAAAEFMWRSNVLRVRIAASAVRYGARIRRYSSLGRVSDGTVSDEEFLDALGRLLVASGGLKRNYHGSIGMSC